MTTPDTCFRALSAEDFLGRKESVTVVDCWRCLDRSLTDHPKINYVPFGRSSDDASAASVFDAGSSDRMGAGASVTVNVGCRQGGPGRESHKMWEAPSEGSAYDLSWANLV